MERYGAVPDEWKETIEDRIVTACVNLKTEFHTLSELTDTICSLGCLYDGEKKRIIRNVPEKKDDIFFESGEKAAFITIDYEGLPEIGLHDSCTVLVAVKNNSKDEQYLEVAGREAFEICPEGDTKDIAPGECRRLRFLIKYREASPVVYDTNLFFCKVYGKNGSLQEEACFGLAGKLYGELPGRFLIPMISKKSVKRSAGRKKPISKSRPVRYTDIITWRKRITILSIWTNLIGKKIFQGKASLIYTEKDVCTKRLKILSVLTKCSDLGAVAVCTVPSRCIRNGRKLFSAISEVQRPISSG